MRILIGTSNESLASLVVGALQRFSYDLEVVDNGMDVFERAISKKTDLVIVDFYLERMGAVEVLKRLSGLENFKAPACVCLTANENERLAIESQHFNQTEVFSKPLAIREFVGKIKQILHQEIRASCLGGGTGLFTLLSGLKTISGIQLSSIVSMSDDGGSTGLLRDIFGILPPGDVRRSLVALSTAPDLVNELITFRFERGGSFEGHNLGNLLLTALSEMRGSMPRAINALSEILNIQGQVIPVTETCNMLKAELEDGVVLEGEHSIDLFEGRNPNLKITKLWQEPEVAATPDALEALWNSKYIILGPGDLFTSVVSNLVVRGISEAIRKSKARKIYICNVMTKPGETSNFQVSDHIEQIIKYLGEDCLDDVVCSETKFSDEAVQMYAKKNQSPVLEENHDRIAEVTKAKVHWADVSNDVELVRHDSLKLAAVLKKIMSQE